MAEKSRMTREWIQRVWADNPCRMLDNGNMITGPVRLAFANILERGKPGQGKTEGSFGSVLLFPEGVDLSVPKAQVLDLIKENAPAALANQALADRLNKPLKKRISTTCSRRSTRSTGSRSPTTRCAGRSTRPSGGRPAPSDRTRRCCCAAARPRPIEEHEMAAKTPKAEKPKARKPAKPTGADAAAEALIYGGEAAAGEFRITDRVATSYGEPVALLDGRLGSLDRPARVLISDGNSEGLSRAASAKHLEAVAAMCERTGFPTETVAHDVIVSAVAAVPAA